MNLIKWTGNPFVDCGIAATLAYCQKDSIENIATKDFVIMSELLMNVYSNEKWSSNLYSIFVNYPINQSAYNLYNVINGKSKEIVEEKLGKRKAEKIADTSHKVFRVIDDKEELIKEGLTENEAKEFIKNYSINLEKEEETEICKLFVAKCLEVIPNITATKNKKKLKFKEFLQDLLSETSIISESGNCIACGRRNTKTYKNRSHIPLIGAGFNFFSSAKNGADFCDLCTFLVQCSPLSYFVCSGLFLVLHTSSLEIKKIWADITIEYLNKQISTNNFTGCMNEGFSNPQNALFHITSEIIKKSKRITDKNILISIYQFSNYGDSPKLFVYEMPSPIFGFVRQTQLDTYRENWQRIVRRGFFFRQKGKQIPLNAEKITDEDFKSKKNAVYLDLLEGKSIIPRFFNRRERKVYSDFALLKVYLKEVLFMNDQRIETIKKVADEIAEYIKQSPRGKRRLRDLEISVKFRDFCNTLRKISKERLELNPEKPLFTFDEFAKELFPEGSYQFGDTRYLILFRLYEQLHDWLKTQEDIAKDEDLVKEIEDKADLESIENE